MTIPTFKTLAFLFVTAALLQGVPAHADLLDTIKQRGKLIVGVKNDYKPFGSLDAQGRLEGFEIDLARAVAKHLLGSEDALEMIPVVASNRIELLNAGRIDVIFATLGVNENRARIIDFTEHYYDMEGMVFLAAADTTIRRWQDLNGRKVCGMQGNLYNRTLSQQFKADLLLYTGTAEIFNAFQDGRCEGIAFDGPILKMKINEPGWKNRYDVTIDALEMIPIAGGVRKGEPRFLEAINQAILQSEADDVLTEAERRHTMGQTRYVRDRARAAKEKLKR